MEVDYDKLYALAERYQKNNPGDKWELLYDHMRDVGFENVYRIRRPQFFEAFSKYLARFGMFRRGGLNRDKTILLLSTYRKPFLEYLLDPSDRTLASAWMKCFAALDDMGCAATPTQITKILMGLGGRFPAIDSRVQVVMSNQPLFMSRGFDSLVAGLKEGRTQLKTEGRGELIPWERILDMALWEAGPNLDDWLVIS